MPGATPNAEVERTTWHASYFQGTGRGNYFEIGVAGKSAGGFQGNLLGFLFGSTSAMMGSLLSHIVPIDRASEFFGLNTLAGRLSAALGPLLFGLVAAASGSPRVAIASVLVFIVGGGAVLATVHLPPVGCQRSQAGTQ